MAPGAFRLFLALVVVVHHTFPLRLGSWAVGLFFALSGYWIARMWQSKYTDSTGRMGAYGNFLASRWWRLLPVFLTVHLLAAACVALGWPVGDPAALREPAWWATLPIIAGNAQVVRLIPTAWSLDVEMQFYLLAPAIAAIMLRSRPMLVAALLVVASAWGVGRLLWVANFTAARLDHYLWLFLVGMAAERFDWRPRRALAWGGAVLMVLLVVAAFAFTPTRPLVWQPGASAAAGLGRPPIEITGFLLICACLTMPFTLRTVGNPSTERDRWLGDLSYPVYLFHWLPRDAYYGFVDWSQPAWQNLLLLVATWIVSLLGSAVLLIWIDRPLQALRQRWLRRRDAVAPAATPKTSRGGLEEAQNDTCL